jgi:molybdenum cofactor cytidylyltransferase
MVPADAVAVVLLAAGRSTRFGPCDKLAAPLLGLPLGLHAAKLLSVPRFAVRIAVVGSDPADFGSHGFETVVNPDPDSGQSGSIRLGLACALASSPGVQAVLIALADMPFVTPAHIDALMTRLDAAHPVVGSSDGHLRSPPALFGAASFDALAALSGDAGARGLLRNAALVVAPSAELADVDTTADLVRISPRPI